MSDEKPRRPRPPAKGGERPMRRRTGDAAAPTRGRDEPNKTPRQEYPSQDKSRFEKPDVARAPRKAAPAGAKPHATKPRAKPVQVESSEKAFEGERVAKAMARAGACSRRDAEQWVAEGRVAVNGRVLASPAFNVREGDAITVDGAPLAERERTRLFLFHKPAGLVTSARDPEERETVFAHIERHHPDLPRVVSVGRLDINTEGLLLLTNDGGLARVLELPATGWTRRYRVRAHGEVDQAMLDTLASGVTVDGVNYAPIEARLDRVQGANAWISMTLTEGKNREIKRVLEHLRLDVTRLIRISFGPFQLGDIAEGAVEEVKLKVLRDQLGKGLAELANVDFSASVREAPSAKEQQERREQAQNRPRKHVSALRKQREEIAEKGPRARIERAITADRKGRAVAVERVIVKGATPLAESRNARRFDKLRREGAGAEGGEKAKAPRARGFAPREGGDFKGARPPRAEGGARFERKDARPPRERKFERGEGPARGPRPPRAEGGKPPRGRAFAPREGAESREARAPREGNFVRREDRASEARSPRVGGAGRSERSDAHPSRAAARRERAEYKGARAPREKAPREMNFERGEGPARGPRAPRAEGGAKPPRARGFAPRERADFKGAGAPRGKEQAGGPRPPRDGGARPPRDAGGKKFDGPRKPGGPGGKPRGPGGSGKPPGSSGSRGRRGPA
jgi:23S rRNA pseudouridine2605 synthase